MDAARKSIVRGAESFRNDVDRAARSFRNKALTDIISAGYETRQELESRKNAAVSNIEDGLENIRDEVRGGIDSLWERLDRYL